MVRRVVAGTDVTGKSVFVSDGPAPFRHDFEHMPGQAQTRIWYTPGPPTTQVPTAEPTSETAPVLAGPGGASFLVVQYAPDSVVEHPRFNPELLDGEMQTFASDIASTFDPDEPGMHRTPTVDYGIVVDGEIWLELDDGAQTRLTPGDTVVQIAGRHAWRNRTDRPAVVAFVLTGTTG